MPKGFTSALLALLTLAGVITVVPPAPASAHDLHHWANQKQQRRAFDPFAGQQCWTVTVRVRVPSHHSHAQVCPTGTTGTYPNCYPTAPAGNAAPAVPGIKPPKDDRDKKAESEQPKGGGIKTKSDKSGDADSGSDTEGGGDEGTQSGSRPSRDSGRDSAPGKTDPGPGTGADGQQQRSGGGRGGPKNCATGTHRHSGDCHPNHSDPPCGDGAWTPHAEHAPVRQTPCKTPSTATSSNGPCGDYGRKMVDVLSKIGNGVPGVTVPERPTNCLTLPESLEKKISEVLIPWLYNTGKTTQEVTDAVTKATGQTAKEVATALQEQWNKLPPEARAIIIYGAEFAGCAALVAALAKGTAASAVAAAVAKPAVKKAAQLTCGAVVVGVTAAVQNRILGSNKNVNRGTDSTSNGDSDDGTDSGTDSTSNGDSDNGADSGTHPGDDSSDGYTPLKQSDYDKALDDFYNNGDLAALTKISDRWGCQQKFRPQHWAENCG